MRFSTIISSAVAAAAVVSAAPLEKRAVTTTWVIETVYSTITVSPSSTPAVAAPVAGLQQGGGGGYRHTRKHTTTAAPAPVPTTTPAAPAPAPSTSEEAPPPAPTYSAPAPSQPATTPGTCTTWAPQSSLDSPFDSCGVSVLDIANKWRRKYGKPDFKWSSEIALAAKITADINQGGVTMNHPGFTHGSMGECITPGFWNTGSLATQGLAPFEVALMGWLCEVSSDPELQASANNGIDVCNISRNVASISGDVHGGTGHHDIFLDAGYTEIGIYYEDNPNGYGAWQQFAGQWTADFGRG